MGLYYYNARWVDVQTGHFTQPDTVTKDGWDHFGYGKNNPVNFNDPSGHDVGCTGYDASRCGGSYNNLGKQLEKRKYTITPVVDFITKEIKENMKSEFVKELKFLDKQNSPESELFALEAWSLKVGYGADWDHKSMIQEMEGSANRDTEYQQAGSKAYYYDTWSNIHYGFIGMEAGFDQDTLLDGAGAAQYLEDLRKDNKDPVASPGVNGLKKFDQPQDRVTIQIGIDLWGQYGSDLQPEDIIWAIEHTSGIQTQP